MFTGIVTAIGRVARVSNNGGLALTIRAPYKGLKRGESVAVSGACLTVERLVKGGFTVHVVPTTVSRTLLGEYAPGRRVNLERAARLEDRLGGHLVQGHVDGVASVTAIRQTDDALLYDLQVPEDVRRHSVLHGSITVDGVSMTVNALPGKDGVQLSVIPFTAEHTTLGTLAVGDRVHVEADVLAKYVRQLCRSER
ncbi:MAG TPA: riboflavin synthase [Gemmatimonadales bacterium]|nr:riboflavin synthase [Gemmatimonadales bacterium]